MRKVIAGSLLVLAIWVGAEISDRGVDGAFGGLFVNGPGALIDKGVTSFDRSRAQHAADAFQRAYDKSEQRVDRLLEQRGHEE